MVAYYAMKMTTTCSPMIGHFCDTIILTCGIIDPSKLNCWKLLPATLDIYYCGSQLSRSFSFKLMLQSVSVAVHAS